MRTHPTNPATATHSPTYTPPTHTTQAPVHYSNVMLIDPLSKKPVRTHFLYEDQPPFKRVSQSGWRDNNCIGNTGETQVTHNVNLRCAMYVCRRHAVMLLLLLLLPQVRKTRGKHATASIIPWPQKWREDLGKSGAGGWGVGA